MTHGMMPTEFFPERPALPWQRIWDIMGFSWAYVSDIMKIFASDGTEGFEVGAIIYSAHMYTCKNYRLNI